VTLEQIAPILEKAREAAVAYYSLTGKPLGITGEIGEYIAARELGLELAEARMPGYDAYGENRRKIQIKTRSIPSHKKIVGQRLGSIRLDHEWDTVLLVLLDEFFEPVAMYEAERPAVEAALVAPGSKSRNERGALSISKFRSIGTQVWGE
jgi:hypothetical protein